MGCDKICDLPDSLLTQILLNLLTKDSVKTSVLSTRWRHLWLSVPGLDIITNQFPSEEVYARFIDRFTEFNHVSCMHIMRHMEAIMHNYNIDRLMEMIGSVVGRGIQHLDVTIIPCNRHAFMCQNIYKSKTLVSLKLANVELKNPEFTVSLPCLKIMKLIQVFYGKDGPLILEKLISGCPLLEDLELIKPVDILNEKDVMMFLRVSSQTLKRCCLRFASSNDDTDFTVEIDAPRLEYLSLSSMQSDRIVVKNLSSLFMIKLDFKYGGHLKAEDLRKPHIFCDFLTRISNVRHMIICERTLKVLHSYSKLASTPQFHNLYHLQADFSSSSLKLLPVFLESCPNLKRLSLMDFCYSKWPRQINLTNVPQCLISTLEYVEIKKWKIKDENETKLVNYFLENSAVLKKLTLIFKQYYSITKQEAESYKKLLTPTKLSSTCEVIIDGQAADDEHIT